MKTGKLMKLILTTLLFVPMGLFLTSSSAAAETTMDNSRSADIQTPVFTTDGTIVCGAKSVWQRNKLWTVAHVHRQ